MTKAYVLVIDTNKYAGNFERDMTAFITGQVGECEVGEETAEQVPADVKKVFEFDEESVLDQRADDHGCHRPTAIWQNKEGIYNSVGIFFQSQPTPEQIDIVKVRAQLFTKFIYPYCQKGLKVLGFRLVVEETITTEEAI